MTDATSIMDHNAKMVILYITKDQGKWDMGPGEGKYPEEALLNLHL